MDVNLLTMMDNLSLAVLSSLDFLVNAVCFSEVSNLDILPIQYGYEYGLIWSRCFARYFELFCRELLFACNQKFRHSRR